MIFAFLDEFGYNGPYISRTDKKFNTSPVFGLAGFLLPQSCVRSFGSCFLQLKENYLAADPTRNGRDFFEWEKKGTNFFTARSIEKYPQIKTCMFRVLNEIEKRNGKTFYHGREKIRGDGKGLNSNGLYKTVLSDTIRKIDSFCDTVDENFVIVLDQNSARKELLVTASKTMYGTPPAKRMICPPFEVESHLNQHMQAADWISTITGRIWNYRLEAEEFSDMASYEKYFGGRLEALSTQSTIKRRRPKKVRKPDDTAIGAALKNLGIM